MAHDVLFTHLHKDHHINLAADIASCMPQLFDNWDCLQAMKGYLQAAYMHLPDKPKYLSITVGPLTFLLELLRFTFLRDWLHEFSREKRQLYTTKLCGSTVEIVAMAEVITRKTLESQVQATNIKEYAWIVDLLGNCVSFLNLYLPDFGLQLLPHDSLDNFHSLDRHDRGEYSQALFKLPMLIAMIRCNRMDCRLLGISKLTDCLLRLWKNLGGESNPSPALRYTHLALTAVAHY